VGGGYNIYYAQAGKLQYLDSVPADTFSYTDRGLRRGTQFTYAVTAWNDCGESAPSNEASAAAQ